MKKTILYVGGGILALGLWALSGEIGRFMGKSAMESYVQGRQEGAVEKAVELAVIELRKQLPMQFDEATTLPECSKRWENILLLLLSIVSQEPHRR